MAKLRLGGHRLIHQPLSRGHSLQLCLCGRLQRFVQNFALVLEPDHHLVAKRNTFTKDIFYTIHFFTADS